MSDRDERLLSFDLRARNDSDVMCFRETRYITVNPFADDFSLLSQIGVPSAQCTKVDAYWSVLGDVVFVRVSAVDPDWFPVGCYRRWSPNGLNLVSVVREHTILRETFGRELAFWLNSGAVLDGLGLGDGLGERLSRFGSG